MECTQRPQAAMLCMPPPPHEGLQQEQTLRCRVRKDGADIPFRRVPLLLDLRKYAVGLVVDAMGAGGELAVALDLLFSTHVAGL